MKCARCAKPLLNAAVIVKTKRGPLSYGPVCAVKMGHTMKNHGRAYGKKLRPAKVKVEYLDPNQLDLLDGL